MPTHPTEDHRPPPIPTDEEAARFAEELANTDHHVVAGEGITQEAADSAEQPEVDGTYEG
ncbi:MAG: hypothetical protein ABJC79_00610 [Acidimicrobiia bacterium]